jgi:hypothetical protein
VVPGPAAPRIIAERPGDWDNPIRRFVSCDDNRGAGRDEPMRLYEIEPEVWINLDHVVEVRYELRARPTQGRIATIPEHYLDIVLVNGKDYGLTDAEAIMGFTQALGLPGFALSGESDEPPGS